MAVLFARIDDRIRKNTAHIKKPATIIGMIMVVMLPSLIKANDLFPIPPQIEKNVDFWTKIYSQYSSNHVVVHDKNDLSVIYTVINLNEFYADSIHLSVKWDVVEEVKSEHRRILQKLSEINSPPSLDSLSKEERHVFILWSHSDDPYKFSKARYAVRAQLGLRDRFREGRRGR